MSTPRRPATDIDRRQLLAQAIPIVETDIEQLTASYSTADGAIPDADIRAEIATKKRWLRRAKAAI